MQLKSYVFYWYRMTTSCYCHYVVNPETLNPISDTKTYLCSHFTCGRYPFNSPRLRRYPFNSPRLIAYSAPSHYLNQCWVIVNRTLRNKLPWFLIYRLQSDSHFVQGGWVKSHLIHCNFWLYFNKCIYCPHMASFSSTNYSAHTGPYIEVQRQNQVRPSWKCTERSSKCFPKRYLISVKYTRLTTSAIVEHVRYGTHTHSKHLLKESLLSIILKVKNT